MTTPGPSRSVSRVSGKPTADSSSARSSELGRPSPSVARRSSRNSGASSVVAWTRRLPAWTAASAAGSMGRVPNHGSDSKGRVAPASKISVTNRSPRSCMRQRWGRTPKIRSPTERARSAIGSASGDSRSPRAAAQSRASSAGGRVWYPSITVAPEGGPRRAVSRSRAARAESRRPARTSERRTGSKEPTPTVTRVSAWWTQSGWRGVPSRALEATSVPVGGTVSWGLGTDGARSETNAATSAATSGLFRSRITSAPGSSPPRADHEAATTSGRSSRPRVPRSAGNAQRMRSAPFQPSSPSNRCSAPSAASSRIIRTMGAAS